MDPNARVTALIARHGASLLRTAHRVSLCADDAHDAYQRAMEIYLKRLDTVDPATEVNWLRVVVRNEALAVRKQRAQQVAGEDPDLDGHGADDQRSIDDRLAAEERVRRSAEVVRQLKPDEAKALLLKAQGHSYDEIGRRFGWTYTKVNRSIAEGRKRFLALYAGIEAGDACATLAPALRAVAQGAASSDALLELRPHLRHCARCRAEVRRLHGGRLPGVGALFGLPALLDRVRAELAGLASRFADLFAPSAATGGGGGRATATAALVAVAVGGVGAGGYGALTGGLPGPAAVVRAATGEQPDAREARRLAPAAAAIPDPPVVAASVAAPASMEGASRTRRRAAAPERARVRVRASATATPSPTREFEFEGTAPAPAPRAVGAVATPVPAPPPAAAPASAPPAEDFGFER